MKTGYTHTVVSLPKSLAPFMNALTRDDDVVDPSEYRRAERQQCPHEVSEVVLDVALALLVREEERRLDHQ